MKCKAARILISVAADGEIGEREAFALDGHLAECAECRRERASVDALRQRLTVWEAQEPAESLADAFAMRLRREQQSQTRRRNVFAFPRLPAFGLAAAAAAVVLFLAYLGIVDMRPAGQKSRPTIAQEPAPAPTQRPVVIASAGDAKKVTAPPAPGGRPTSVARAPYVVKRVAIAKTWRRHRHEAPYVVALSTDAAGAVAVTRREAERQLADSATRLRSLVTETNITIEGGLLRDDSESVSTNSDVESGSAETPS